MPDVTLRETVNVMVTPQFYTLKKEALPVKYAYQAKKIAPSLFDGLLEEDGNYEYMVSKEEEDWVFIAYDIKKITDFLALKGIKAEQVSKLYFAQQALASFTKPLLLGEKEALVSLDNTVVVVPQAVLEEDVATLTFSNDFTPKSGIGLQGAQASLLTLRQAVSLAVVFTVFALMFMVEGWRYGGDRESIEQELETLYASYPSLQSTYTRESIAAKYSAIDTLERRKRDVIKSLSDMIFKDVTLTSLKMDEKTFKAVFSCKNAKVVKRVKALAQKEKFSIRKITNGNDLYIEGRL